MWTLLVFCLIVGAVLFLAARRPLDQFRTAQLATSTSFSWAELTAEAQNRPVAGARHTQWFSGRVGPTALPYGRLILLVADDRTLVCLGFRLFRRPTTRVFTIEGEPRFRAYRRRGGAGLCDIDGLVDLRAYRGDVDRTVATLTARGWNCV